MRIYLDSCCLQRPFDDQTQPRIKVEAEAVLAILAAIQAGDVALMSSEALEYEIQRIPNEHRRHEALSVLTLASELLEISDEAISLAEALEQGGMKAMDSVHVALASVAKADFFATCDDPLLRRGQATVGLGCKIISVLNLVPEIIR